MRVTMVSAAGHPGRPNEDFTGAVPGAAVLVDGAGIPGAESVCRHGVAWYARRLGGTLLALLAPEPGPPSLPALLAEAVRQVTDAHRGTCDVADPISPSATVAVLRLNGDLADYLVLGDCFLALDLAGAAPLVVTDPREVVISGSYEPALEAAADADAYGRILRDLRARRNAPGGFWVAKDDPRAADEAVTGSVPIAGLTAAALLSNGAARFVERFRLAGWPEVMSVLASAGPAGVIHGVRRAEASHGVPSDDATITHCAAFTAP
ncbi:integrase [Nonomuraea wenchangensis]|uniref:integrase n=1 Tax=Nonomuraea wenchangensis TaxID=568860 RepID=UPI00331D8481